MMIWEEFLIILAINIFITWITLRTNGLLYPLIGILINMVLIPFSSNNPWTSTNPNIVTLTLILFIILHFMMIVKVRS